MAARYSFHIVLFLLAPIATVQADGADGQAVKREVLVAWDETFRNVRTFQMDVVKEGYLKRGDRPHTLSRKDVTRYVVTDGRNLFSDDITEIGPGGPKQVDAQLVITNSAYQATLAKSARDDGWLLTKFEPASFHNLSEQRGLTLPWTICGNVRMYEWLENDRVVVTRVERLGGPPNLDPVRLHFTYNGSSGKPTDQTVDDTIRSGFLDLDAADKFRVTGYRFERKTKFSDWTETAMYEYAATVGGLPVLMKTTVECPEIKSAKFGLRSTKDVSTYQVVYNRPVSDDVFWLSHYGLPEPNGVIRPRHTPWYLWLLAAALGFTFIAGLSRWLARRRKRASSLPLTSAVT